MKNKKDIQKIFSLLERSVTFTPVINKLSNNKASAFKILITTMLSARTKDEVTELAAERLFSKYKNAKEMISAKVKDIEDLIYPVGFYKTKALNVIDISKSVINEFNGKVPKDIEGLTSMSGVGLKTATLVMAEAFGMDEICVDTHVHRISNRLGLVSTKTPQDTHYALKKVLPKRLWRRTNFLMVSYGKTVCTPVSPKCTKCILEKICIKKGVRKKKMGQGTLDTRKDKILSGGYGVSEKASVNKPAPCSLILFYTSFMPIIKLIITGT